MKRVLATLAVTLAAAAAGVGSAFAGTPVQSSTQSTATDQAALAASDAVQIAPSNGTLVVRVLSPGSDGTVTQTNNAASSANAGNTATTTQNGAQTQASACGCASPAAAMTQAAQNGDVDGVIAAASQLAPTTDSTSPVTQPAPASSTGVQASGQAASTDQAAAADSSATQVAPSNQNVDVRVLSPGNGGSVSQTNNAASSASSGNTGTTTQTAGQSHGGSGVQSSVQHSGTGQESAALSETKQIKPSNSNVSVRVLSPGNNGDVSQTNNAASSAISGNTATTAQTATQNQSGSGCGCEGKGGVQSSDQSAHTGQASLADSTATQIHPSNDNGAIGIGTSKDDHQGCGCDGSSREAIAPILGAVSQTNNAASSASSGNTGTTTQTAGQSQGGAGVQSSVQHGGTHQHSAALSEANQFGPSNSNGPVGIGSAGNTGNVTQANNAVSSANSGNRATTAQTATQNESGSACGCEGKGGVESSDQSAHTGQASLAGSSATQIHPSNDNGAIGIGTSKDDHQGCGCGGSSREAIAPIAGAVSQTNNAASSASSGNTGTTTQTGTQAQSGSSCGCTDTWGYTDRSQEPPACGCHGTGVQASGQSAQTDQGSLAHSKAEQIDPSNDNGPIGIGSWGNGENVSQTNNAASSATSGNTATTSQTGTQSQPGTNVQALGQQAWTS